MKKGVSKPSSKKQIFCWALYDWANSSYVLIVVAGFFPLFFKQYWASDLSAEQSTFQLGLANSAASLCIVLLAPLLGSIADAFSLRKRFLFFFTCLGILMCGCLTLVSEGNWQWAIGVYIFASIGFSGGVVFSDSLLVYVATEDKLDVVSALGYGLGYLGGGLLFVLCVWMMQSPHTFLLESSTAAIKLSFSLVAIWWAVFSIPIFLYVNEPESHHQKKDGKRYFFVGYKQLRKTFSEIRRYKVVWIFLLSYWLYIDGVDTIVRMAIDYGLALNLDAGNLIMALLLTQFVSFPAAIGFGYFGKRFGPKLGIQIALLVYIFVVLWAYQIQHTWEFYMLAVMIGLVQGGIQSLSRSLYARIIPVSQSAEFFGFYNMLGKFAAVLGPVMVAWVTLLSGSHRLAMLSIIVLFVSGGLLLMKVDVNKGTIVNET